MNAQVVELSSERKFHDLDDAASLILQKHQETFYIFKDKLWAITVDTDDDYVSLSMVEYPDVEDQQDHITEMIIYHGWSVSGGKMRDQIIVDFNE